MEQKIFNKSDESKIKLNLNLQWCNWWLRSAFNYYIDIICSVDVWGYINYIALVSNYNYGILPVCTI